MRHSAQSVVNLLRNTLGPPAVAALERHITQARPNGCLKNRTAEDVRLRMLIVCVVRDLTGASYPEIAHAMGLRTHSSALRMYTKGVQQIPCEERYQVAQDVHRALRLNDERVGDRFRSGVVAR